MTLDWITAVATLALAVAAYLTLLFAVIVLFFQDRLRAWMRSPDLRISFKNKPPWCRTRVLRQLIESTREITAEATTHFYKLAVENEGGRAEQVEVYAKELLVKAADGQYEPVLDFLPMNLRWVNTHHLESWRQTTLPGLSNHAPRLCELGQIVDPAKRPAFGRTQNAQGLASPKQTVFELALEVEKDHLLVPGEYQLGLIVLAANSNKSFKHTVEINLTGKWNSEPAKMMAEGLEIRVV